MVLVKMLAVDAGLLVIVEGVLDAVLFQPGARLLNGVAIDNAIHGDAHIPSLSAMDAAADAPAKPVPTTITLYLRLLAGLTSLEVNL